VSPPILLGALKIDAKAGPLGQQPQRGSLHNTNFLHVTQRAELRDGTYGNRVVRPEWDRILTTLRRGGCNALMVQGL